MARSLYFTISSLVILASSGISSGKTSIPVPPTLEERMLSHVERILVIDSLNVDRHEFFRHYRLAPSSGRIISGEEVAFALGGTKEPEGFVGGPYTGFTNEFNDYMIWAQEDTTGYLRLAESVRLIDGTWSTPEFTSPLLNSGEEIEEDEETDAITSNAAFPFMLDDGQTLYFASDNANSLGGYDIFIATKDPSDGEFLIPGNIGMPFNSVYDDYMMAMDLQTGIGWWTTDRNQIPDQVTIYIYAIADERVNVDPEDEELMAYATLSGWETLLDEEQLQERDRLKAELGKIQSADTRKPEFMLPMPGGTTYKHITDFANPKAAAQMQLYLAGKASYDKKEESLKGLRERYAKGDKTTAMKIKQLEEELRTEQATLAKLLSEIYKLENR